MEDQELASVDFQVSKLRLSFKMKKRRTRSETSQTDTTHDSAIPPEPDSGLYSVPVPHVSNVSNISDSLWNMNLQSNMFRSRQSSTSSTDSGFLSSVRSRTSSSSRSRTSSSVSSCSRPVDILRKIAMASETGSTGSVSANCEFEGFHRPNPAPGPTYCRHQVPRSNSFSSDRQLADKHVRMRPRSSSTSTPGTPLNHNHSPTLESSDSFSDYSEYYSTIDELTDPFTDDDNDASPPIPPRKATLRLPAKPPYPSTAVKAFLDISKNIN